MTNTLTYDMLIELGWKTKLPSSDRAKLHLIKLTVCVLLIPPTLILYLSSLISSLRRKIKFKSLRLAQTHTQWFIYIVRYTSKVLTSFLMNRHLTHKNCLKQNKTISTLNYMLINKISLHLNGCGRYCVRIPSGTRSKALTLMKQ
jgi:hypothetical protein